MHSIHDGIELNPVSCDTKAKANHNQTQDSAPVHEINREPGNSISLHFTDRIRTGAAGVAPASEGQSVSIRLKLGQRAKRNMPNPFAANGSLFDPDLVHPRSPLDTSLPGCPHRICEATGNPEYWLPFSRANKGRAALVVLLTGSQSVLLFYGHVEFV